MADEETIAGRYCRCYGDKPHVMRIMCDVNGQLLCVGGGTVEYRFDDESELMMNRRGLPEPFEYDPDEIDD